MPYYPVLYLNLFRLLADPYFHYPACGRVTRSAEADHKEEKMTREKKSTGQRRPRLQLEITFGAVRVKGRERTRSCLSDGTMIYPATRRFRPRPGDTIDCYVDFRGQDGRVGLATPVLPHTLSPEVWLPPDQMRADSLYGP